MKHVICSIIIAATVLMTNATGRQTVRKAWLKYRRAMQEVEAVQNTADRLENPLDVVRVKAKAASLLWTESAERSRAVFVDLWDKVESQTDKDFDKEEARTIILRYLFPKDRALADRLLKKTAKEDEAGSDFARVMGTDPQTKRLAFTAYRLAETDVGLAAAVLEKSLARNTSPMFAPILTRIREKDPSLANTVAERSLGNFLRQPRTMALVGLNNMIAYLFPYFPSAEVSPEVKESDERLRFQFVSIGYQVLGESLAESEESLVKDQGLQQNTLTFRTLCQATLAATLAALSPRYAPQLTEALDATAKRLSAGLPNQLLDAIQVQVAAVKGAIGKNGGDGSEAEIISSMARGDFEAAQEAIDKLKDEKKRLSWGELLLKARVKTHLGRGELFEALSIARKMRDGTQKMLLMAEIAKVAHEKREPDLLTAILYEVKRTSADVLPKGIYAVALLTIAAETAHFAPTEAMLMLQDGVATINSLADVGAKEQKGSRSKPILNDPSSFADSAELMRAFSALGEKDLERTLSIANRLENKAVQMVARLATVERAVEKGLPKSSSKDRSQ